MAGTSTTSVPDVVRGGFGVPQGYDRRHDTPNHEASRRDRARPWFLSARSGEFRFSSAQTTSHSPRVCFHRLPSTRTTPRARRHRRPTSLNFDEIRPVSLHFSTNRRRSRWDRWSARGDTPRLGERRLRGLRRTTSPRTSGFLRWHPAKGVPWTTNSSTFVFDGARGDLRISHGHDRRRDAWNHAALRRDRGTGLFATVGTVR